MVDTHHPSLPTPGIFTFIMYLWNSAPSQATQPALRETSPRTSASLASQFVTALSAQALKAPCFFIVVKVLLDLFPPTSNSENTEQRHPSKKEN